MKRLLINNPWPEASVYYIESTTSTMDLAHDLLAQEPPSGTVIMAGYQTKGRGRFPQRRWESLEKQNLLFTLMIKARDLQETAPLAPLMAGYSLNRMLEEKHNIQTQLKWPNDLLFDSKKLAGILCEAKSNHILIGIGLNCNQCEFPAMGKITPSSLKCITNREFSVHQLLSDFLNSAYTIFHSPFDARAINPLLYQRDQSIVLDGGKKQISGVLLGLSADGGIWIQEQGVEKPQVFYSGEILY